jgi:hypothetical protein
VPSKKLPNDPRDYYVHHDVSIEQLADLYKGQKGCTYPSLRKRCTQENWSEQRRENYAKKVQKTDEKIVEQQASKAAKINEAHNELSDYIIKIGQALFSQYIEIDKKTGKKVVTCKPSEYRAISQTLREEREFQRKIIGLDKEIQEPPPGNQPAGEDDLIEKLNATAVEVWSDYGSESDSADADDTEE